MDDKEKRELLDWLNDDDDATTPRKSSDGSREDYDFPVVDPPVDDHSEDELDVVVYKADDESRPDPPPPQVEETVQKGGDEDPVQEDVDVQEDDGVEEEPVQPEKDAGVDIGEDQVTAPDEGGQGDQVEEDEDELDRRSSTELDAEVAGGTRDESGPAAVVDDAKKEDAKESESGTRPEVKKSMSWDIGRFTTKLAESAASTAAAARASASMSQKMSFSLFKKNETAQPAPPVEDNGMFSIGGDDDEEEDDQSEKQSGGPPAPQPSPPPDPAAVALAQHKIAGLEKGQTILFDSNNLPDTVLYSALKLKPTTKLVAGLPSMFNEKKLIRCIAVNRERLLVFDTFDLPVRFGARAVVKSNHHLTELVKLTFPRAREKDVVTIHLRAGCDQDGVALKANTYKVPRAESLIKQLQDRLARFR